MIVKIKTKYRTLKDERIYGIKKYCKNYFEIENYKEAEKDGFNNWVCHHRLEITEDLCIGYYASELQKLNLYYNRPPEELIFLTKSEHGKLHKKAIDNTKNKAV